MIRVKLMLVSFFIPVVNILSVLYLISVMGNDESTELAEKTIFRVAFYNLAFYLIIR